MAIALQLAPKARCSGNPIPAYRVRASRNGSAGDVRGLPSGTRMSRSWQSMSARQSTGCGAGRVHAAVRDRAEPGDDLRGRPLAPLPAEPGVHRVGPEPSLDDREHGLQRGSGVAPGHVGADVAHGPGVTEGGDGPLLRGQCLQEVGERLALHRDEVPHLAHRTIVPPCGDAVTRCAGGQSLSRAASSAAAPGPPRRGSGGRLNDDERQRDERGDDQRDAAAPPAEQPPLFGDRPPARRGRADAPEDPDADHEHDAEDGDQDARPGLDALGGGAERRDLHRLDACARPSRTAGTGRRGRRTGRAGRVRGGPGRRSRGRPASSRGLRGRPAWPPW